MRARVTAIATLAVLITLSVAGAALVLLDRSSAQDDVDESLAAEADNLEIAVGAGDLPPALGGFGDDDSAVQIVDATGSVVAATANVAGRGPLAGPPTGGDEVLTTLALPPDGDPSRILVRPLVGGGHLVVASTLDDIDERTASLATGLALAVPVVTVVLAAVVWWLTGRTLSPVDDVCAQVDAMDGNRPGGRIAETGTGDEIDRLVRTVNGLLARIEGASRRQRRFVADASHELRSPLARIRTELEVDLAHPAQADPTATHRSVLDETAVLEAMVDDLLLLASLEEASAGVPTARRAEPVDLGALVTDEVARRRHAGGPPVMVAVEPDATVLGDATRLRRVVRNLLDNAERHADEGVEVSVGRRGGHVELVVDDDGPGIPASAATHIFERFARVDGARAATAGGTGLGLAIVREVTDAHGGTARVATSPTGGARLVVTLPFGPVTAPQDAGPR